jgi:hypothetical protein
VLVPESAASSGTSILLTFTPNATKPSSIAFFDNTFYGRFDESKIPPRSPQLTTAVRKYLFILCNLHYLSSQGYIDESIWHVWRSDIESTLNALLITREWPDIKYEFRNFKAFTQFVEDVLAKGTQAKNSSVSDLKD